MARKLVTNEADSIQKDTTTDCPRANTLAAMLRDELPAEDHSICTLHVEECTSCHVRLETLIASDMPSVTPAVRDAEWNDEYRDAIIHRLWQHFANPGKPVAVHQVQEPPVIPGYDIRELIGRGGMGAVYRAVEAATGRVVAIKVLAGPLYQDHNATRRFRREIALTQKCVHANIVRAYETEQSADAEFLVMEYVHGINLSAVVRQAGRMEIGAACECIRQAALGLQHAHDIGLVHRDIKPSNLLVTDDGILKLSDLGLARFTESDGSENTALTATDQIMGTVDYMAPEQVKAGSVVDHRADIYALGSTFFKLLTGSAPFETDRHNSLARKLTSLAGEDVRNIREVREDIPESLARIVHLMLMSRPEDRISTAGEVATAVAPFCNKRQLALLASSVPSPSTRAFPQTVANSPDTIAETPVVSALPPLRASFARYRPTQKQLLTAAALSFLIILSVVTILGTDGGRIRIVCSDPNLQVQIVRNGKHSRDWTVGQVADSTWFRSGEYEVRIPKKSHDRIEIRNGKFRLSRGGSEVVTIEIIRDADSGPASTVARDIRDSWKFAPLKIPLNQRSVDILTSDDWEWTPAKPLGPAINDGISINIPASPSMTPDGLNLIFGRYEASITWNWLIAGRKQLADEFEIHHRLPQSFQFDYSMAVYAPVIVSDSEARGRPGVDRNTDLYAHQLNAADKWDELRIFDEVNSDGDEDCPTLSVDGLTVVYGRRSEEFGTMDLWMATRPSTDVAFEAPFRLSDEINSMYRESSPALSSDQLVLIYHSTQPTDAGKWTLWFASRQSVDEPFKNPQRLIVGNPEKFQLDPALAVNGKLLVFRQRPPVLGGLQSAVDNKLYFTERVLKTTN